MKCSERKVQLKQLVFTSTISGKIHQNGDTIQNSGNIFFFSQSFSQSLEQFFLTVGQNNFGNKKPIVTKLENSS